MAEESIENIPGIGEKTAEKLKEAGFTDMMSIAASSSGVLSVAAGIGDDTAARSYSRLARCSRWVLSPRPPR
jgi:DNA repair protein RadA